MFLSQELIREPASDLNSVSQRDSIIELGKDLDRSRHALGAVERRPLRATGELDEGGSARAAMVMCSLPARYVKQVTYAGPDDRIVNGLISRLPNREHFVNHVAGTRGKRPSF